MIRAPSEVLSHNEDATVDGVHWTRKHGQRDNFKPIRRQPISLVLYPITDIVLIKPVTSGHLWIFKKCSALPGTKQVVSMDWTAVPGDSGKCAFLWLISQPASDCSEWREKYIEGMSWHIGRKQLFARLHFVFRHGTWEFFCLVFYSRST